MPRPRVVVADAHRDMLEKIGMLLEAEADVVGRARSCDEAVDLAVRQRAEVLVIDMDIEPNGGYRAITALRRSAPGTRVILLGLDGAAPMVRHAQSKGAWTLVSKVQAGEQLLPEIWAACGQDRPGGSSPP